MNNTIFFSLYNLAHQSVFLDWVIVFCANILGNILILISCIFLLFYTNGFMSFKNFSLKLNLEDRFKNLILVFSSASIAWVFTTFLKSIIASPRPFMVFNSLVPLFIHGGMDSFPSGHATFFMALAVSVYLINKRLGSYLIMGAIFIGLARIASGVHFPIDILFGYIIGLTFSIIFCYIFKGKFINSILDYVLAILTKRL